MASGTGLVARAATAAAATGAGEANTVDADEVPLASASDDSKPITFTDDRGVSNQPFPNNYRAEVLAFLKTWRHAAELRANRTDDHANAGSLP